MRSHALVSSIVLGTATFAAAVSGLAAPIAHASPHVGGLAPPLRFTPPEQPDLPGPPEPSPPDGLEPEADLFPLLVLAEIAGFIFDHQPISGETRLEDYLDDGLARERVAAGMVDSWFYDLAHAMRRSFRPDMRRAERERRIGMDPLELIIDELSRYATPPSRPQDPVGMAPPEIGSPQFDRSEQNTLRWMEQTACHNAPVTWYRVELSVTHNPEGEVSAAWITRSSGLDAIDEAAMDAVRTGAGAIDPPPARVFERGFVVRSDWAFEAGDVGSAANVMCGVEDEDGVQTAGGGRGLVRKRLELIRIRVQEPLPRVASER